MARAARHVCGTLALILVIGGGSARALEGDQYYAWGRDLDDATDVVNAKVHLEIDLALDDINSDPSWKELSCHQVLKRIVPRFKEFIFQEIEVWAANSDLVPRIPATPEEERVFRETYLYRNTHALDVGTKAPRRAAGCPRPAAPLRPAHCDKAR